MDCNYIIENKRNTQSDDYIFYPIKTPQSIDLYMDLNVYKGSFRFLLYSSYVEIEEIPLCFGLVNMHGFYV